MEVIKHKHKDGVIAVIENNDLKIKSTELVEIINDFRKLESEVGGKKYFELKHKEFMRKIRNEIEKLKRVGINDQRSFTLVKYIDKKGEERPCYELNRDGMLQILNSESALVRHKTIEYIRALEERVNYPVEIYKLIEGYEERLNRVERLTDSYEVTASQRKAIKEARSTRVRELLGGKHTKAYKNRSMKAKVFSEIGRIYNNYFNIPTYECTPRNKFEEAIKLIKEYSLSPELKSELNKIRAS
ncbi:MAG: hypothetical protein NSGCLCUN01_02811 [uncultured Clostridium sp.]